MIFKPEKERERERERGERRSGFKILKIKFFIYCTQSILNVVEYMKFPLVLYFFTGNF